MDATFEAVKNYVRHLTPDRYKLDDVTEAVLVEMHTGIKKIKGTEKFLDWLSMLARGTVAAYYERIDASQVLSIPAEDTVEGKAALVHCIRLYVDMLPEKERLLLDRLEIQHIPQLEYASMYQVPMTTLASRWQKARKRVKDMLADDLRGYQR